MRNARLATFEQHTLRRGMRSRGWRGRLGRPHNSSRPSSDAFGSARFQFCHKGWLGIAQSVVTGSQDPYAFCWGRCKRRSVSCAPTMQEFCSCEATNCNGTRQDTYPGPYGICFLSPPTRMPTPGSSRSRSRCRRQLSKSGDAQLRSNLRDSAPPPGLRQGCAHQWNRWQPPPQHFRIRPSPLLS